MPTPAKPVQAETPTKAKGRIAGLMPPLAKEVFGESGLDLVRRIGLDVVRQVILEVLCGRNLRDSTETLTRRRIAMLNAATLAMFLRGAHSDKDFIARLPDAAAEQLKQAKSKAEMEI
jgi:hypothetical protein